MSDYTFTTLEQLNELINRAYFDSHIRNVPGAQGVYEKALTEFYEVLEVIEKDLTEEEMATLKEWFEGI